MTKQRKVVLYTAASLDGFLATEDHNLEWLFAVEGEGDNGYSEFFDTVDTILLGRVTYDWLMDYEKGNFPYKDKECYIFSRTKRDNTENVTFVDEDVIPLIQELKKKQGKNIWLVGGGGLNNLLLGEGLIDEMIVTIAPVLLGRGIPMFKGNDNQTQLQLKNIMRYNQFVALHYDVCKN